MSDSAVIAIGTYAALSLVIGGACVTYEAVHQPVRLDRADGRSKFPSPKMSPVELVLFGLFVAVAWPFLAAATIRDATGERK